MSNIYLKVTNEKNWYSQNSDFLCLKNLAFFVPFILSEGNLFNICVLSKCIESFSLKMYIGSAKTYDFCMLVCFAFMFAHTYVFIWYQIVRLFENRIPIQAFEKWHNVSYRYVSYVKSETSDIWRTGAWFLKPFRERVEENHTTT